MTETLLRELHSADARRAVAEALVDLFDHWGIDQGQEELLIGMPNTAPFHRGEPLPDDPDVLERAGHLLAIGRALKRRYPDDSATREHWVRFPNRALGDFTPLLLMLGSREGLEKVRDVAESDTGGLG